MDDIQLYQGLNWLERKHIIGKVQGSVAQRSDTRDVLISCIDSSLISATSQLRWYVSLHRLSWPAHAVSAIAERLSTTKIRPLGRPRPARLDPEGMNPSRDQRQARAGAAGRHSTSVASHSLRFEIRLPFVCKF